MKSTTLRRLLDIKSVSALAVASMMMACGGGGGETPTDVAGAGTYSGTVDGAGDDGNGATPGDTPTDSTPTGTTSDPIATDDPYAIPTGKVPMRGINIAGAEFGEAIPGREGTDYKFPTTGSIDYYLSKGMNTVRVGFKWERLQPTAQGEFDATYFAKLDEVVSYAASKGAHVILNPHNFARYFGTPVGSAEVPNEVFADLWKRLATHYAGSPNVMFNLVNEPRDMPTMQWVGAANAAIAAIRGAGARNVIHAPGNNWTGAHSWFSTQGGVSNAEGMLQITDPIDNTLFEVHQYLDANSGGGSGACVSETIGSERLVKWVGWLREHGKKGFIGEFAGRNDATCKAAVDDMLTYMHENSDVISGWLWWAGGPGWGEYVFTLEPSNGQDRPQMAWLTPFLAEAK